MDLINGERTDLLNQLNFELSKPFLKRNDAQIELLTKTITDGNKDALYKLLDIWM